MLFRWDCAPIQQSTNGGSSKLSYCPLVWTSAGLCLVQVGRQSAQLLPIRAFYSDFQLGTWLPCWASPSFNRFVVSANPPASWGMHMENSASNFLFFLLPPKCQLKISRLSQPCLTQWSSPPPGQNHRAKVALAEGSVVSKMGGSQDASFLGVTTDRS